MPANATSASVEPRPLLFAGLPAASWAFAVRTWLACLLALYASFWLELDTPSSAAITVAILALPTRGQGMEKAGFRLLATVIGVVASIAIAGFFSQSGDLLLAVFSLWVGLCVFAVGMLDGNRAYAAALCCITVALIAIQQIDSPQQVFTSGVERGAALAIGVLASALINDVLAAPNYHPVLLTRLEGLHRQIRDYLERVLRGEKIAAPVPAGLLRDIVGLHPEVASLMTESSSGAARSAAARSAMVDLASELHLARAHAALSAFAGRHDRDLPGLMRICRNWLVAELARNEEDIRSSLDALQAGRHPLHEWRAPLYRSRRIAAEGGVRAAIYFALAAVFFVVTGWPTTELCLSLVAVIIGPSSTAPDSRLFTAIAVAATPIACLLAGILKYFVFNGVSEFQLLAIGLAPVVIGLALLISLPNRLLSPLGRLSLVFTLAILAPTNPQSYDPNVFVITCLLSCLASILVFVAQLIVPPLSGDRRLQILLDESHRDAGRPVAQRLPHIEPEEATFRDATRIEQILAASAAAATGHEAIDDAMHCFDRAAALRRCCAELDRLATGPLAEAADTAKAALDRRDPAAVLAAAETIRETAAQHRVSADSACAVLVLASVALGPSGSATVEGRQP
jgi:uncharacterized membrane protein YccC